MHDDYLHLHETVCFHVIVMYRSVHLLKVDGISWDCYLLLCSLGCEEVVVCVLFSLSCSFTLDFFLGWCSGTLSYIFNNFDGSKSFSQIVTEAKAAGFTEPDPRDDLSGMDVARKVGLSKASWVQWLGYDQMLLLCFFHLSTLVKLHITAQISAIEVFNVYCLWETSQVIILAREAGLHLELDEIPIQSLVPKPLRVSPSSFLCVCQLLSGGLDVNQFCPVLPVHGICLQDQKFSTGYLHQAIYLCGP